MQVDDVILGVGGKPFTDDARKSIAIAIQAAEKVENGGILKLTRWRDGKTEEVQLKLRVMGNNRRVGAVRSAIEAIESATTQPELRSIGPKPSDSSSTR
jgi:hypothetical protein